MTSVLEALGRVAAAAKEPRLPRAVGGNARDFIKLGLIADRVRCVGRVFGEDQIDLILQDQILRRLCRALGFDWQSLAISGIFTGLPLFCNPLIWS